MSPASASIRQRLLALGEPCAAQSAADWQGDIALPAELERFYREVGPLDCTLESAGNPFFPPPACSGRGPGRLPRGRVAGLR